MKTLRSPQQKGITMMLSTGCKSNRMVMAVSAMLMSGAGAALAQLPATTVLPISFGSAIVGQAPGGTTTACTTTLPTAAAVSIPGDGCPETQVTLNAPYGSAVDSHGNVYFGDYNVYALRVLYMGGTAVAAAIQAANPAQTFTPQVGYVYTLAGSRQSTIGSTAPASGGSKALYCNSAGSGPIALLSNGDGCPATDGYIKPRNPVIDPEGNVIFSSGSGSAPVRVVYIGGPKMAALISTLNEGTAIPGFIYSIVRSSANGYGGDGALGTDASVHDYSPRDVAVDSTGSIYLSDGTNTYSTTTTPINYASNNDIRRVDINSGIITTYAGSPSTGANACAAGSTLGCAPGFSGDGGPATSATFNSPYTIWFDQYDNLYITDYNNDRVRVVYKGGTVPGLSNLTVGNVYTVIGGGATSSTAANSNVPATSLVFGTIYTGGIDQGGNLYVVDGTSKLMWRVDAKTGTASYVGGGRSTSTTVAGQACATGSALLTTDKLGDGCPATQLSIVPSGKLPFDRNGNFYEIENGNNLLRKFSFNTSFPATAVSANVTQPLAFLTVGAQTFTTEGFALQGGATTDYSNAGSNTCTIGTATTAGATCVFNVAFAPKLAGLRPGVVSFANATATLISEPIGGSGIAANVSLDPASTTTIGTGLTPNGVGVDLNGNLYIADSASGRVLKVAATGGTPAAFMTGLSTPGQVAVDGQGNVYVADQGNNRIAMTSAAGGTPTALGSGLSKPQGVVVDTIGNVYVADTGNNRIVEISPLGAQAVVLTSGLSGPTKLAMDASGNLYVADAGNNRVLEIPVNSDQQVLNLGTSTVTPGGIAVDAAGELYVADSVSGSVLLYPQGVTNAEALVTGLTGPKGLAVDSNGSVYVADASAAGVISANRHNPSTSFPNTNLNTSNSSQINVVNTGNAPLLFNGASFASATGNTAVFSLTAASTNGCVLNQSMAAGAQCALNATFTPTAIANYSETATLTTNAANTGQALLSGAGVFLVSTTTALAITQPTTSTISYSQAVTVTATVTAASNAGAAPTGTITFSVDGKKQTPVSVPSNGVVTLTLNPAVGAHAVSLIYSGDTLYASSSNSVSFTVLKATTVTTLSLTPGGTAGTPNLTLTATVSSPTATGETGTVTFYAGSQQIGSPATVSGGKASVVTTTLTYTSYVFTAVYSGDTNFNGSSSTASMTPGQLFSLPSQTALSIPQGGVATITTLLTPLFNYVGTVTASCSGLPANSVCRFSPVSQQFVLPGTTPLPTGAVSGPMTYTVYVYTNVQSSLASFGWVAVLLGMPFAVLAARRRSLRGFASVAMLLAVVGLGGCAGGVSHATSSYVTPTGTSNVTVTLTDTNGNSQSFVVALTVLPAYPIQ